jgi:hypothetical protein
MRTSFGLNSFRERIFAQHLLKLILLKGFPFGLGGLFRCQGVCSSDIRLQLLLTSHRWLRRLLGLCTFLSCCVVLGRHV